MKLVIIILILLGIIGWRFWRSRRGSPGQSSAADLISRLAGTGIIAAYFYLDLLPGFRRGGRSVGFALLVTLLCVVLLFILWGRSLLGWLVGSLLGVFDGGTQRAEARPLYSVAEARRKQGRLDEAVAEVRNQLERFPTDFEGQLLLATIQAEDLNDFPAAQTTLEELVSQKEHPPHRRAFALNTLADWHLKFAQDPDAARAALKRIMQLFPETELAQNASQRIVHLPVREELLGRKTRAPVALPHHTEYLKPGETLQQQPTPESTPEGQTEALVRRLERFPGDNEAREQLALLYAEHYHRLDLAVDQLEQLVAQPNAPARHVVHWLNLIAELQLKLARDRAGACQAYQRIVERYPHTPAADKAARQIAYLGG